MIFYWLRKRLFQTIAFSLILVPIITLFFVFPCINKKSSIYNSQSIYKKSKIDFIVPEPSFDQVNDLPGTNGIGRVFPYFLTNTQVDTSRGSRTSTVLLSDDFGNLDLTMYNPDRLIEKSNNEYNNAILVDWQFCHDTSVGLGDTVSINVGGEKMDFIISAIYETNSIYDGGALLAKISQDQKEIINNQSKNNGYSGMYVEASNYSAAKSYFRDEYRPLGRLKERSQFDSDEQYELHYEAIMSSGFANEITDFKVKSNSLNTKENAIIIFVGAIIYGVSAIVFNLVMINRGCEKHYFSKNCIPKGQNVRPYYVLSSVIELIMGLVSYIVSIALRIRISNDYIPQIAILKYAAVLPIVIVLAVVINFLISQVTVSALIGSKRNRD